MTDTPEIQRPLRQELAALRRELSGRAGRPVILCALPEVPGSQGPAGPAAGKPLGQAAGLAWGLEFSPAAGTCAYAASAGQARRVAAIYQRIAESGLEQKDAVAEELADLAEPAPAPGPLQGEVALVTGAASGIGKACAAALLARGAAVAGLDLNPAIAGLFEGPSFLGMQVDVADEAAVGQALDAVARAFGGLDMLVLNAGVFPAGCNISGLALAEWQRVMRVNLDANLTMLRECYPLLKLAPRYGRVVVNGSRNVPAPGPGAAAYSCSKAALTQLARVAALEWAKDGIRVNIFHAHAVFDTGIWTPEVLQSRAAHYGMTVDQYKKNNLLHTEINSADVGELVAEMCGPLFAKTTGAQVPIDGGSDRVV